MLGWRARAAVYPADARGRCWLGNADQVGTISAAELDARSRAFYTPRNSLLLLVGGVTEAQARGWVGALFGELPAGEAAPSPLATEAVLPTVRESVYERAGAPFVTAAFPAPALDRSEHSAFAVAVTVLETRLHLGYVQRNLGGRYTFSGRGREIEARFPPVVFDLLGDPDLVLFNRRGRDQDAVDVPRQPNSRAVRILPIPA
jgi:predicted Zn-dependent peptidase